MAMSRTRIATTIADRTLAKGGSKAYAKEVAALLLSEGRVGELDSLLRDIQADWATKGYVEVIAKSAHQLTPETRQAIVAQVKGLYSAASKVVVTEVRDADLIGGVQISLSDKRLDLSVQAKLNQFKQLARNKQ